MNARLSLVLLGLTLLPPALTASGAAAAPAPAAPAASTPAAAPAPTPVNTAFFSDLTLDGFDPVAYFVDGKPVAGSKDITYQWNGATWRFATAAHRVLFMKDPAKYAPQYGGWCAWAMARGEKADIDPQAWKIVDGKLYLNYSKKIQADWEKDAPGNITKADAEWKKLLAKK